MVQHGSHLTGAVRASAVAGPIFWATSAMAAAALAVPDTVPVDGPQLLVYLAMFLPAAVVGFFLALPANLIGAAAMAALAEFAAPVRAPIAWWLAGAASGGAIAALTGAWPYAPAIAAALVATSAGCARICRASLDWDDEE